MTNDRDEKKFKPAWWLPEGHTQTLWRKLTAKDTVLHRRERLELADGDFIDIDWCEGFSVNGQQPEASSGIIVVIHGLGGCSSSPYIIALQNCLAGKGKRSVAMNFRGCSGEPNNLARAYHSGVSEDLNEVFLALQHLKFNKHEVILFHLSENKTEFDLEFANSPHKFIDIETKEEVNLNPIEIKKEFKKRSDTFLNELKTRCLQYKIDLVNIDINKGVEEILISYLLKRHKMF